MISTHSVNGSTTAVQPSDRATSTLSTTVSQKKKKKSRTRSRPKNDSKRKMELRSRRNVAESLHNTTTTITAASSPASLLQLPQEIKNCIYRLVLGGNLLHIRRDSITFKRDVVHSTKGDIKEQRFTNQICSSPISEEDAQECFEAEDDSSLYVKGVELRHSGCSPSNHKSSTFSPHKMNINLLHTCRQIYNEARFIPYSTNTFSFDTPRNFRAFIHVLNHRRVNVNHAFRSLRIELAHINHDLEAWARALFTVTDHMKLLETVYINVDQRPKWSRDSSPAEKHLSMLLVENCLTILGKTTAQSIMIFVGDQFLERKPDASLTMAPPTWITHRWTVEEKRVWAENVKFQMWATQLCGW